MKVVDENAKLGIITLLNNNSKVLDYIDYMIQNFEKDTYNPDLKDMNDYTEMKLGKQYYDGECEIVHKKRLVTTVDSNNVPQETESKSLSNTKLNHGLYRKIVNQKVSYVLGKPFSIKQAYNSKNDSKNKILEQLTPYLDDSFYGKIQKVGSDAVKCKIGWLYTYYEDNQLKFKRIDPLQVIPKWKDSEKKELEHIIYHYHIYTLNDNKEVIDTHLVEFYEIDGRTKMVYDDDTNRLTVIEEKRSYMSINGSNYNWDRIPWTWFRYNDDDKCLITQIKSMLDEYDLLNSYISDMIKDAPNALLVVKGYSAGSVEEFQRNSAQYRKLMVQADGGVDSLETPLQVDQYLLQVTQLRKDLYESACAVDNRDRDLRDTSGTALKFLFSDLDMDCQRFITQLKRSLHNVFYFMLVDVLAKKNVDLLDANFDIVFNTDIIINETETINNIVSSSTILPLQSLIDQHPWTINGYEEYKLMKQQQNEAFEQEKQLKETSSASSTNSTNA